MTVDSGLAPREGTPYGDPKPPARIVDRQAIQRFRAEAPQVCQLCGGEGFDAGRPAPVLALTLLRLTVHHIVPRGQGGDDVDANFALVCGHGTAGCHGDLEARRNGARSRLRERLSEIQVAYVIAKKGQAWLDRHYPLPETSLRFPDGEAA